MRRSFSSRRRTGAFTLMEVLLVLVILVVLASLAGVFLSRAQQQANISAAQAQIGMFKGPLEFYQLHNQTLPTTQQGLMALVEPPADLRVPEKWQGPYLEKGVPNDPWGQPYQYELITPQQYHIWSVGADGQDGTDDDISS